MASDTWHHSPFATADALPPGLHAMLLGALEAMGAHPELRRVRRTADAALRPAPGQRLLDAGCGLGEVARSLAAAVAPTGTVLALDLSADTVAAAAARDDGSAVEYRTGDVTALALPDGSFDAVRSERVLQHLADPDAAIAELVRVTRPGGRICVVDTDWDSLAFDGLPADLTAAVLAHIRARMPGGRTMGRTLRRRLVAAGLADVTATPVATGYPDPASAAVVLPMVDPQVPPEAGMLPDDLRNAWFAAVREAGDRGDFLAVLTIWVVAGCRPGPGGQLLVGAMESNS